MHTALLRLIDVSLTWASRQVWRADDSLSGHVTAANALWHLVSGELELAYHGGVVLVSAPSYVFIPGQLPRDIRAPNGAVWLSAGLEITLFGSLNPWADTTAPVIFAMEPPVDAHLRGWIEALLDAWTGSGADDEDPNIVRVKISQAVRAPEDVSRYLLCQGLAQAITGAIWPAIEPTGWRSEESGPMPSWLVKALVRIRRDPLTDIATIADEIGISTSQLRRGFKRWVGISPQAFIIKRRLEEARRLVATTEMTVASIAETTGFESVSHFSDLFGRAFGAPPGRYRASQSKRQV
jgi:AraC-like DNA-binding protein